MTIRKNFVFDDEIVDHLKAIAEREGTNQTEVVRNLIEEKYQEISIQEKLQLLNEIADSAHGLFIGKSVQSIKADMDV